MNKPDIRFNGFNGEWEEKNYKEVFDTSVSNNTFSRAELTSEKTSTKNVHYGDILIKYNSILSVKKDDFPFIPDNVKVDSKNFLKNGDIVFADTAEDETCGKAVEITDLENENVLAGLHTFVARPKFQFQEKYLGYFINSPAYHNQLIPYMQGTKVTSISKTNVQKTSVKYPNATEQIKIGNLFSQIDSLISSTQKEHDKLVSLKKCMLQKMFPKKGCLVPEIRFKGFTGEWVEKKLGEIFRSISNAFVGTASPYYVENGHFYLESNNVKNGQINRNSEIFINDEFYYNQRHKWIHENDIVMVQSGHVGHSAVIPKELDNTAAHALIIFTDKYKTTDSYFINYSFMTSISVRQIEGITKGNTIKHILSSDMKNFIISIPNDYAEQQKIGSYFQNLDNLISKQSQELEKLQNIKKTLLSKMFV